MRRLYMVMLVLSAVAVVGAAYTGDQWWCLTNAVFGGYWATLAFSKERS